MWNKIKFIWAKSNRWHRGFLFFLLVELRVVPAGQLGFKCNDPALSYPFTGDTISWKLLLATTVLLPLVVMLIVERKYHTDRALKPKKQALLWYKEYLFGVLVNLVVVQTLKLLVGSPRPHFFDTCSPKEAFSCEGSEYVSKYTCTKAHWLSQSDKSFPSGHTSLALHAGLFIAYYLHRRISRPTHSTILAIQVLSISTAVFCSVSRMVDHRHHWWDVLAGAVISAPILYFTIKSLCGNFDCQCEESNDEVTADSNNHSNISVMETKVT